MNGYFIYGSQLYGTTTSQSDIDCAVIGEYDYNGTVDSYYSPSTFKDMLHKHEPTAMEGYSLQFVDVSNTFHNFDSRIIIDIDLGQLRAMYSGFSSNSFSKAKKKLKVEKDYDRYASMKSLFHCIRIPIFGTQIAKNGFISNFREANDIFHEIVNDYNKTDGEVLELIGSKYKKIRNEVSTEFRKYAPKLENI